MLYSPRTTTDIYLIDVPSGDVAHAWRTPYGTGHGVYLTPSGDLIRLEDDSAMGVGASISIPGDASLISVYDWEGVALFTKVVNNATHRLHHQIDPHTFDVRSGTGTLFALTAYRLECDVARGLGRLVCDDEAGMYVEAVLEIDTSGAVVWEWYLSNHVCAVDCAADVSRVDINSGEGHAKADWVHANSLVYDAEHDVLLLGGAYTREVYVIDHSAPSETPLMAAGSGSLLLRVGSDRFGEQHDVRLARCAPREAADEAHGDGSGNGESGGAPTSHMGGGGYSYMDEGRSDRAGGYSYTADGGEERGAPERLCFTVFNNGRYRASEMCAFNATSGAQLASSDCGSEVIHVTVARASLGNGAANMSEVQIRVLFDAQTVPSLLGDGSEGGGAGGGAGGGPFLRICEREGGACLTQSRFFSLILSSAALVGAPFANGSYVSILVGVYGTYFEAYWSPQTGSYTDVRFVYQNGAQIQADQQPPAIGAQCTLPALVGLSRTAASGWSTSVFHAMRYAHGYLPAACTSPPPPPPAATCVVSSEQAGRRCICQHVFSADLTKSSGRLFSTAVELSCEP